MLMASPPSRPRERRSCGSISTIRCGTILPFHRAVMLIRNAASGATATGAPSASVEPNVLQPEFETIRLAQRDDRVLDADAHARQLGTDAARDRFSQGFQRDRTVQQPDIADNGAEQRQHDDRQQDPRCNPQRPVDQRVRHPLAPCLVHARGAAGLRRLQCASWWNSFGHLYCAPLDALAVTTPDKKHDAAAHAGRGRLGLQPARADSRVVTTSLVA